MRRTKHRRRFHTSRIIWKREARRHIWGDSWWSDPENQPALGRLRNRDFYLHGCSCLMCKWDKHDPSRRARERRDWKTEVADQLASM